MTTTTTWSDVTRTSLAISRLTHGRGQCSCFSHLATDVADERYYPEGVAGAIKLAEGLTRVEERFVGGHYHLADAAMNTSRNMARGYYVQTASGLVGPFASPRGAKCVRTRRNLVGAVVRRYEEKDQWIARAMERVDRQLALESAWRDAADTLADYAGVADMYDQRGRRWFDATCQESRRKEALHALEAAADNLPTTIEVAK